MSAKPYGHKKRILNRSDQRLKSAIQKHKNRIWESKFQKLSVIDQASGESLRNEETKITQLHGINGVVYTDEGKADHANQQPIRKRTGTIQITWKE